MEAPVQPVRETQATPRRGGRGGLVVLLILLLGFGLWLSLYSRWPTGPASGEGISGTLPPQDTAKQAIRFATFNMHSGVGGDDVFNLQRTLEEVKDVDFCALQEVRGFYFGPPANQAQQLGEATNHAWLFLPTEYRYWHTEFGNAVLTRLAVGDWYRLPLPIEPKHSGRRNVSVLQVKLGTVTVRVLVTHVDREQDQTNQLRMVRKIYQSLEEPSVLLADLNMERKNEEVQRMLALPGVHDCIAEADHDASPDRIDWILCRGLTPTTGGHIQNGASDHSLYWVDLTPQK